MKATRQFKADSTLELCSGVGTFAREGSVRCTTMSEPEDKGEITAFASGACNVSGVCP